ncbi:MAG: rod shape-determining protein [Deltaproteobacteria bacterium]|nr:rod shape-determining protein [Deltaproteobacteria bacterium]MBW1794569.1 rod shape-determining protein [Deltaproteobacteria bacterium]MBW2329962.1 rod shape-determining protein [Deltaproteobacteria bacterium]
MQKAKVLNVGIDMGTSRTVVAADNGVRTFIPSYVGYPKDAVSKKMLGKAIVFGDEALKYRMGLDLYRPIEKGVIKYSDAPEENVEEHEKARRITRELLKHVISLVTEEEEGALIIRGVIGAPALASTRNKKALLEISKGVLDDVLIVSEPFAVAYGLNMLTNTLIIDIGAGTVDLCRMYGTIPGEEDQITTFKAGDYIDEMFLSLIKKKYKDANFTVTMIKRFKEENAFISEQGESISIDLPVKGKPVSHDVTDELREACRAIVPDIVEGIRKLVATFDPEFQDELKGNIVLAGGGSQIIGLKKEIETYMKKTLGYGKVTKVEEPLYAGANGALMLCKDMPDEYWDELKSHGRKRSREKGKKEE